VDSITRDKKWYEAIDAIFKDEGRKVRLFHESCPNAESEETARAYTGRRRELRE